MIRTKELLPLSLFIIVTSCSQSIAYNNVNVYCPLYNDFLKYQSGNIIYDGNIKNMDINYLVGKVVLDEDLSYSNIKISEDNSLDSRKKVHSYYNKENLNVNFWLSELSSSVNIDDKNLLIKYPKTDNLNVSLTTGSLISEKTIDTLDTHIKLTTGSISLNELETSIFHLIGTTGHIKCNKLKSDKSTFFMSTGSIDINNIESNNLESYGTTGRINISNLKTSDTKIEMTTGDIQIDKAISSSLNLSITTGSINANLNDVKNTLISCGNGNIKLNIPSTGAKIKFTTKTGNLIYDDSIYKKSDIYNFSENEDSPLIDVKMDAGNLYISK